jgi:hypothetical protein
LPIKLVATSLTQWYTLNSSLVKEEEGEEEEGGTVKKRIKKERPGVTAVDCIEYWQGYGRLWTSEREDQEAASKTKEAQREERGLQFVADAVGQAASSVMKLKRKWNTIFRKVPINYRLYEWLDPRFEPQWKKSMGVVYLKTCSPIRANHSLGKFLIFKKAQYTTEDWIRYIVRYGDFRYEGEPLPLLHFLVHRKVETLEAFIHKSFNWRPIGGWAVTVGLRKLEDDEMLTDHWVYKAQKLECLGLYLNQPEKEG